LENITSGYTKIVFKLFANKIKKYCQIIDFEKSGYGEVHTGFFLFWR